MHLTNSITEILRCLDRLPKKNIQHVFLKVTKHKQPCLTAEMLGKHTWNIWSLFSQSFHRLRYWDDADFLGYKPTFMDMWWHLYNKYFYPDIFTTHIYYSILISIYIYISCTSACPSSSRAGRVSHVAEFRYGKRRLEERPRQRSSGITQIVLAPNMWF